MLKQAGGVRVSAPNDQARQSGLRAGMRLADARALLPDLETRFTEPEKDARELNRLADWCQRYTPIVSVDGTDSIWLDITGAAHLHGGEVGLIRDLGERLHTIGFDNKLGLAETPGAAWAIARFSELSENQIIPTHGLLQALHELPVDALRLDGNTLALLKRFGLKTVGALCALPRASLKRRFPEKEMCEAVLHRLDQIFGRVAEPITPLKSIPAYAERLSFPEPILATESFHHGLHELLERLTARMEKDGKGATRLTFSSYRADGGVSHASVATARPSRDAGHLAHLFRDRVETIDPGFGVDVLVLSAKSVELLGAEQKSLSGRLKHELAKGNVDQLIDRLANRLGAPHVQRIAFRESHLPERAESLVPALRCSSQNTMPSQHKSLRPSRLLARPEPLRVMAVVPEGPPMQFTWRRMTYRVVRTEGPERIAPEWWLLTDSGSGNSSKRTRDYYRVEDYQGRRFWLFREGLYSDTEKLPLPVWYMHGFF